MFLIFIICIRFGDYHEDFNSISDSVRGLYIIGVMVEFVIHTEEKI